jgi:hypothetical protein
MRLGVVSRRAAPRQTHRRGWTPGISLGGRSAVRLRSPAPHLPSVRMPSHLRRCASERARACQQRNVRIRRSPQETHNRRPERPAGAGLGRRLCLAPGRRGQGSAMTATSPGSASERRHAGLPAPGGPHWPPRTEPGCAPVGIPALVGSGLDHRRPRGRHPAAQARSEPLTGTSPRRRRGLLCREDIALRERVFWRIIYETAACSAEVLRLNVENLDLPTATRALPARRRG